MKYFSFCFLLFSLFANANEPLPLEHFTRHGDYLDMKLSPDGKHIAARLRQNGKVMFVILETATMKAVGGVQPGKKDEIHSVEWINNERLVYQYAEKQAGYDAPIPTGELFAVNFDNSNSKMLFGYRAGEQQVGSHFKPREASRSSAEIISYLPNDPKHILIAEYPFEVNGNTLYDSREKPPIIVKLNVTTGRKRKVEAIPFKAAKVFANDNGDIHFVRYRTEYFTYKTAYRESAKHDWIELADVTGDSYLPLGISADGKKLFMSGNFGEKSVRNIFEFTLETGDLRPVFSDIEFDAYDTVWDAKLERPVVTSSSPTRPQYHYADGDSAIANWHKSLREGFNNQYVTIPSQSKDGKFLLIHVRSDVNPGEYYLFDTTTKSATFLWANRSWLDPRNLAKTTPFSFTAKDGVKVYGQVTLPKETKEGQRYPFITMIHGGPHGPRDEHFFDSEVQLFANRGYAVVQVNFRGSGGYGRAFEHLGYKHWGTDMIQDITEGTEAAIEQFPLHAKKGCVYGASYGGYAAMMSAAREPDMFECVIGYVGLYNLSYFFTESDTAEAYGGMGYLKRVLGTDEEELRANSPVYHADKIKANVMIIHGDKDARVPVINAKAMIKALSKVGNEPEYLNFSQSGHGVYDEKGRYALYDAAITFFDQHLK
jgi:dipeptidyl aminopeptidase/acylaminoacyl peptidase